MGSDGPSDLAGADAHRLQIALAAVLAIDSRGPVLAESVGATTGRVALADGAHGSSLSRSDQGRHGLGAAKPTGRNILAAFNNLGFTCTTAGPALDRLTTTQRQILGLLDIQLPWIEQTDKN